MDHPTETNQQRLTELVARSQKVMAHAWMIRTFVKHSDEVDDFPELNEMARAIFDAFRAVETQVEAPAEYFKTVRKKLGNLRSTAEQFAKDAWTASTHTNFQQAVISVRFVGEQLQELLAEAELLLPKKVAPAMVLPRRTPAASSATDSASSAPDVAPSSDAAPNA